MHPASQHIGTGCCTQRSSNLDTRDSETCDKKRPWHFGWYVMLILGIVSLGSRRQSWPCLQGKIDQLQHPYKHDLVLWIPSKSSIAELVLVLGLGSVARGSPIQLVCRKCIDLCRKGYRLYVYVYTSACIWCSQRRLSSLRFTHLDADLLWQRWLIAQEIW